MKEILNDSYDGRNLILNPREIAENQFLNFFIYVFLLTCFAINPKNNDKKCIYVGKIKAKFLYTEHH